MYADYALTSITAYNLLVYSTVSHDESFSSAISVVGSTGSAEGERRLRILNISAQKPDGTLEVVYPKEGMPYIPDGVAAFANADDVEDAKLFIEWLFSSDENLKALADIDKKTTLLLALPTVSGLTLDFDTSQLMDEDLSKFGSEREATLAKWDEVTTGKEVVSSK